MVTGVVVVVVVDVVTAAVVVGGGGVVVVVPDRVITRNWSRLSPPQNHRFTPRMRGGFDPIAAMSNVS